MGLLMPKGDIAHKIPYYLSSMALSAMTTICILYWAGKYK